MRILSAFLLTVVICGLTVGQSTIRINSVSSGTPDYVEIYNCGTTPVDLSGYITGTFYSTGAGAIAEPTYVLPGAPGSGTTMIAAGGFLIIQENGTAGSPGTLPNSISNGFNYFWVQARTLGAFITDPLGIGVDYMYRDFSGEGGTPFLPLGTAWSGTYTGGTTDFSDRIFDGDSDTASDWGDGPVDTPAALQAGQTGSCSLPPAEYETNDASASLDLNGTSGSFIQPAITLVATNSPLSLNMASTLVGNPFDIAVTVPDTLVPLSGGGAASINGQIANINLLSPGLTFLFGGSLVNPFVSNYPGNTSFPFTVGFPITAAAQMYIFDPGHADGFSLSAGAELNVIPCPAGSNFDSLSLGATLEPGWSNATGGNGAWTVNSGGTPSTATGPTAAFSGPNYLYCETSVAHPATYAFDTCPISIGQIVNGNIDFQLSRIGATMGTLDIQIDDGVTGTFVTIASFVGSDPGQTQGGVEWTAQSVSMPPLVNSAFVVRFFFTTTTSFTSDVAIDDLSIN